MMTHGRRPIAALLLLLAACSSDDGDSDSAGFGPDPGAAGVEADRLIGLNANQVTGLLGPADFRRTDGPAEIMQYRGGSCVLDLYLYADRSQEMGDYRVKYVEARDRQFARLAPQACLSSVVRLKRSGISG